MCLAILAADRDVLARHEFVHAEAVAGLIVTVAFWVVDKHPTRMFEAAWPMNEPAELVVLLILQSSTVERPSDAMMVVKPSWAKVSGGAVLTRCGLSVELLKTTAGMTVINAGTDRLLNRVG